MGGCSRWRLWLLGQAALLAAIAGGCSHRPDLPPLAPVSGTVTLDGQPLAGARLEFIPELSKGTKGPPSLGTSDQTGHYELTTLRQKGAAVGFHKVKIIAEGPAGGAADARPKSLIPPRYNDPSSSGFSCEVKTVNKGETNEVNLPLTSKPQ
jgi:hypothetical protein